MVSGLRRPSLISANHIDTIVGENSVGIDIAQSPTLVVVSDNEVRRVNTDAIQAFFGVDDLIITGNVLVPGSGLFPSQSAGSGITISFTRAKYGARTLRNRYRITGNSVVAENRNADGIILNRGPANDASLADITGAAVTGNHVVMHGSSYGGITLLGRGVGNTVSSNRIDGAAEWALGLVAYDTADPRLEGNALSGNDLTRFAGALADVYFGPATRHNHFSGDACVVVDEGEDNVVELTGCTKL